MTVDQYFTTEVDYIIDTVNVRLQENPDRKFICASLGQAMFVLSAGSPAPPAHAEPCPRSPLPRR